MEILAQHSSEILAAFWVTIKLTVYSAVGALVLGTVLAAMRLAPVPVLNWIGATYVNIVRNTPLTLIILFCSFGLSQTLGITLADPKSMTSIDDSNFRLAVLGLTAYTAAFVCETVRSGVNTVPLGQAEAARSLGFTFGQNLRMILLPQAFRAVIIPLGSVLIALTKNTTIASAIGVAEAALKMKELIENTAALLAIGGIFAAGFVILTLPLGLLFGWLGKRLAVAR
ncbi:MAG TPA: amino acid ABC transporter permease [Mycobacterium sp.]|nr:amino acid ABC transporter permease [Mycobacterium sp.]